MKLIILGASGLTGSEVLDLAIGNPHISEVTCFLRRTTGKSSIKLKEILIETDEMLALESLPEADTIICCLGTTIKKAGSQNTFRKVDVELPLHFARLAIKHNIDSFIIQSSIGAGSNSSAFYLKCKTEVENELKKLGFKSLVIVRPSLLLGDRKEFRLGEKFAEFLMKLFSPFFIGNLKKYKAISSGKVAERLVKEALEKNTGTIIIESDMI